MVKRTIIPNDFRDFISIAGIFSAIGIFWQFFLGKEFFIDANAIFFMVMGVGLLISGKVLTIRKWFKDGIQQNELLFILSILIGGFSLVAGILIAFGIVLPPNISSIAGFLALFIAIIIAVDYYTKNTVRRR